ncbi:unnamed protein product [Pleuronectes platessa]|uniref:Uncharacterized protein n=1 Tax=Pleuronectes platessa TaxID=8262 RepID=A0A9N7TUH3_PLEPL|nr:unnamed protein product [Pleuronectes platessa]
MGVDGSQRIGAALTPRFGVASASGVNPALITAAVCDIISNARRFGVATASGVTSQAPARQGLALTPRFCVASASGQLGEGAETAVFRVRYVAEGDSKKPLSPAVSDRKRYTGVRSGISKPPFPSHARATTASCYHR